VSTEAGSEGVNLQVANLLVNFDLPCEHATGDHVPRLRPLSEMLDGMRRTADEAQLWDSVAPRVMAAVNGAKCRVEAATLSPTKMHLATCSEARTMMGIRVRQVGAVYDLSDTAIIGRLAVGRRTSGNASRDLRPSDKEPDRLFVLYLRPFGHSFARARLDPVKPVSDSLPSASRTTP
jgi:hypothetical protein